VSRAALLPENTRGAAIADQVLHRNLEQSAEWADRELAGRSVDVRPVK
jgi:hypothetical protein